MVAHTPTYFPYLTPHGPMTILVTNAGVVRVVFGDVALEGERRPSDLANRTATELQEYFAGRRRTFDIPLAPQGTAFQRAVWNELAHLGYGQTCTNTDLARALGKPSSYRAVGAAVHDNPLAVLVPDHRVIGANGRPLGADTKSKLRSALLDQELHLLDAQTKG